MLSDLLAETRGLRETILHRIAALGGSAAETIVDNKIGEFLFYPEYAGMRPNLVDGRASDSRVLTLLVLECLAGIERENDVGALGRGPSGRLAAVAAG